MLSHLIHRQGWVRGVVVDSLEVAVGLVINLFTEVLVCLGPHLREVS